MSAPSYEVLYDFESQIEDAFSAILLEQTGVPCFTQRSETELTEPRYEVQFSNGPATQHFGQAKNTYWYPDGWRGTMRARAVSQRRDDFTLTQHRAAVAALRRYFYQFETYLTETLLPHLIVQQILETSSVQQADPELELDVTEVQFAIDFYIRSTAWPEDDIALATDSGELIQTDDGSLISPNL